MTTAPDQSPDGFATCVLPADPDATAPDGSGVRVLLRREGGSMAHFELPPGRTSRAVVHRTVDEIWYVIGGRGQMWRKQGERAETVALAPGVCLTIPVGTHFQFRALGPEPLLAVAVTMPPWPDDAEATLVEGPWQPAAP